jgi:phage terminase large subunit-like protein
VSGTANLEGVIIYTLGCRSGLNVPDVDSGTGPLTLDFAQAFAQRGATYVANTGNGYGDTRDIALSERLMYYFTQRLGKPGGTTVGEALMKAKLQYIHWAGIAGFGLFDEKALGVSTLYGLPMYEVSLPGSGGMAAMQLKQTELTLDERGLKGEPSPTVHASAIQQVNQTLGVQTVTITPTFSLVTTAEGNYYTVDNDRQARPGRPIMPRTGVEIETTSDTHGALLLSATYSEEPFTPLVTALITDGVGLTATFQTADWYPAQMAVINRLPLARETLERLVVIPAQYRDGELRRYTQMTYQVYYSDATDDLPPEVQVVEGSYADGQARFSVWVISETGVERVVVTYDTGAGELRSVDLAYNGTTGRWEGALAIASPITYFVQAVDTEGDVMQADNKGRLYTINPMCGLLEGDLDCNCVVDIADVMAVASRWRTSCDNPDPDNNSDTPNYDPRYDMDVDCDIDIVDIMRVVAHWGERCQAGP